MLTLTSANTIMYPAGVINICLSLGRYTLTIENREIAMALILKIKDPDKTPFFQEFETTLLHDGQLLPDYRRNSFFQPQKPGDTIPYNQYGLAGYVGDDGAHYLAIDTHGKQNYPDALRVTGSPSLDLMLTQLASTTGKSQGIEIVKAPRNFKIFTLRSEQEGVLYAPTLTEPPYSPYCEREKIVSNTSPKTKTPVAPNSISRLLKEHSIFAMAAGLTTLTNNVLMGLAIEDLKSHKDLLGQILLSPHGKINTGTAIGLSIDATILVGLIYLCIKYKTHASSPQKNGEILEKAPNT